MAYDVSVFGTIQFKRGKFRAWKKLVVDSREHRTIAKTFPKKPHRDPIRVEELLPELSTLVGAEVFTYNEDDGTLHVRGRFTQTAFEARARQLAALFLAAADVQAEGDVCFLGDGVFVGFGISLGGGRGVLLTLSPDQVQNASMDPELDEISGYFRVVPPAAPSSVPQRPATSVPPSSGGPRTSPLSFPSTQLGPSTDAGATGELVALTSETMAVQDPTNAGPSR